MCVQDIDVQCVLQFTLIHAAGCALHRHTSRVIHRLEWFFCFFLAEVFVVCNTTTTDQPPTVRKDGPPGPSCQLLCKFEELCVGQKKWRTEERRLSSVPRRSVRVWLARTVHLRTRQARETAVACSTTALVSLFYRAPSFAVLARRFCCVPWYDLFWCNFHVLCNDPSAGSPTETLLRLLLPLDVQVCSSFRHTGTGVATHSGTNPRSSLKRPIGSSDGRCVQRAGT